LNPIQITFRGMTVSEALAGHIEAEYDKLLRLHDRVRSAHAVIEQAHRHHQKGNHFQCHLTVRVPGRDVVVSRTHDDRAERNEDAYAVVDDAFRAARRMLAEHVERVKLEPRHESGA
jgi:ribosome-associated translation inhibitor RaiA